jgi:hypothetical protein
MAEDVKQQVADLTEANLKLQTEKDAALELNATLAAKVEELEAKLENAAKALPAEEAPKPVIPTGTFTVEKVKYEFTLAAFNYGGAVITAETALADEALCKELVAMGAGVIKRAGQ